jgi:[acyl-carrier-protein] S-malonyltransferase
MGRALASYKPGDATRLVYSNVTSEAESEGFVWPGLLEQQLLNPVRWTESVQHMIRDGFSTFVECGGGEVLSGLIRRIDKSSATLKVADPESLEATVSALSASAA